MVNSKIKIHGPDKVKIYGPILRPHMIYSRVFLLKPKAITDLNYDLARKKFKKIHPRKNGVRKRIRTLSGPCILIFEFTNQVPL